MRTVAIVCVLATQALGAGVAGAATKDGSRNHDSSAPGCAGANVPATDEASRERATKVILCLVNRERRALRRAPLRRSRPLARAAVQHSVWIIRRKSFSHSGSKGDVLRRARRTGYVRRRSGRLLLGETLAWGAGQDATPAALVASFMGSRAHRRTLIDKRYRDVGIGMALGAPTSVTEHAATLTLDLGRR